MLTVHVTMDCEAHSTDKREWGACVSVILVAVECKKGEGRRWPMNGASCEC